MTDIFKDWEVININPGNIILCDLCNKDFTNSDAKGGYLFGSKAVCPDCAENFMKGIKKYKEEKYIKARPKEDETFRDFIYRIRRGEY